MLRPTLFSPTNTITSEQIPYLLLKLQTMTVIELDMCRRPLYANPVTKKLWFSGT